MKLLKCAVCFGLGVIASQSADFLLLKKDFHLPHNSSSVQVAFQLQNFNGVLCSDNGQPFTGLFFTGKSVGEFIQPKEVSCVVDGILHGWSLDFGPAGNIIEFKYFNKGLPAKHNMDFYDSGSVRSLCNFSGVDIPDTIHPVFNFGQVAYFKHLINNKYQFLPATVGYKTTYSQSWRPDGELEVSQISN